MIAKAERIETVVTILSVVPDRFDPQAFSIEALVPDFTTPDRNIPTKFIKWAKGTGNAPSKGDEGLAILEPTMIQKRHVESGKYPSSDVTGIEMAYEVNWAMRSFSVLEASAPSVESSNTYSSNNRLIQQAGAVKQDATPTAIDAFTRYKSDQMSINDREAVRLVIEHGKHPSDSSVYATVEDILAESEKIAASLNRRFLERLIPNGSLVEAAVESGAEIVDIVDEDPESSLPEIRNEKELRDWITDQGYQRDDIIRVLRTLNVSKVTEYLSQNGKTAQGLAQILHGELGDEVQW